MVLVTAIALLSSLLAVVAPPVTAEAAGTLLFQNDFDNRTVDGTGTVTKPTPTAGTNAACLTAAGNSSVLPLLSCPGASDLQGNGKLRLTNATGNQIGGIFGGTSFPSSNGLDVMFKSYQWGGNAADGMSFVLSAVDPANPVPPTSIGPGGGSLGYSPAGSINGLPNAYLGVGLDVFGNYSSTGFQGSGCTNQTNITTAVPGAVVVRGPGNARAGYCGLTTTYTGTTASRVSLRAATRAASLVPVQVLVNPTSSSYTSGDTGVVVAAGTYKVVVTPVGGTARTLTGPLPAAPTTLYPSTTWTNANGVPRQLAFGFVGSTGGSTDNHEIDDVRVLTFNPVPQLAVSTTSHVAPSPALGAPVNYVVTPSVKIGAGVASPISVTQTVPAGVTPVGAFGAGWSCAAAVGRSITCTTTASSFPDGTTLPVINVVGIVTANGLTATTVQNASTTTVSSADGNPATVTATTAGTVPAAPTGVSISPAVGPVSGGGSVTVSATSSTAPTAIEIGTTAEQQAGTPVVLLPCQGSARTGCFLANGSTLTIPSMPARSSSGPVTVTVVTLGVASTATYTYADRPATLATPTASAGITSTTLTWVAPEANGSPITSYVVTPYLNGTAQTPVTVDGSTTTRTFTGLTAGGSYRYTVQAVNAFGTSTTSPQSLAVVPYDLPGAPVISTVAAGTEQATLTWTTPADNGSAVTGYVVTPYIGAVAQAPRTFTGSATTQTVPGLTAGTAYTFTVAAVNAAGTGPPSTRSTAVTPNASPTLSFAAPPGGQIGVPYSTQLTVDNGTSPFTWSVSGGNLPAGLTLSASGLLSGTPTASGSFAVTVQVVDASGQTATRSLTLAIAAAPVVTFSPAAGEVTVPYSQQPIVTGGSGPFRWAVTAGSLPAGLSIDAATGLISGTPTASGSVSVTVSVTDSSNQVASRTVTLVIAALPTITSNAPPAGQVGLAYSTTFTVTGGTAPLAWSVSAGNLPSGLSLNSSTGVLSGTPTATGSSSFTVLVSDAFGKTASRAVTLVVNSGPLVITKTADVSSVAPGGRVSYTIAITNSGSTAFSGVNLSDPLGGVLDDAVYSGGASATTGTLTYSGSTLGWTGNVAGNATVTITYAVVVNNPDLGNKVLANTVSSSTVGTNCPSGSSDNRCTATVTVSGLSIVHTASSATTTPGSTVTFNIVVTNTGRTPYAGASLTENLAGMLDDASYQSAAATTGSVSFASPTLSWSGDLAVGATATITYSFVVAETDVRGRVLDGTVVSPTAGSSCPAGNAAASCTAAVTVLVSALSITTTAAVSTTTPGSTVPYTVTLANTGQTAYTATTVAVALAGALDDATYNVDAASSAGAVVFDAGTRDLVWTGALAVGATVTITASVTVLDPDPGNRVLTVDASSSAAGSTCPPGGASPACTATVQVLVPALTITKSSSVTSTTPGSVVGYTVLVTNTGQTPYTGAGFDDDLTGVLDDATYGGDATATAGTVTSGGGRVRWTGDLAVGASATVTYSVTVADPDVGNQSLTSRVTSSTRGTNCTTGSSDTRCTSTVPVLTPRLSISSVSDVSTTTPGSVVRFTTTVTNAGQTSYNGAVITLLTAGILDDAVGNGDRTVTTGSLAGVGDDGNSSWTLSLAPGQSGTLSGAFTVRSTTATGRSLDLRTVSGAPGSSCPTASSSGSCSVSVPVLIPELTITKTADAATVVTGGTVAYTVAVTNTGETTYQGASFEDPLVNVLTDAVYAGDAVASSGTLSYAGSTLAWSGDLAPGANATITYSVVVRDPDPGDKRMINTVVSTTPGSNCARTSTDSRCTSVVDVLVPGLTIAKTADVASSAPGGAVGFTVTVTNSGTTPQTGATFADALSGVLDDATYAGGATASSGTVGYAASTLTWTGDLAVGASATIRYTTTVKGAGEGDNQLVNRVVSSTRGSNCAADSADRRCQVAVPVARLLLVRTAPATTTPGALVQFPVTFTNTGRVPYVGISVTMPRADSADDVYATDEIIPSSGTIVRTDAASVWTGDIPVGGTVTIPFSRTAFDPPTGNRRIKATLVSDAPGNNCPPGTSDPRCSMDIQVLVPGLSIAKAADVTSVEPGGTVAYTVTLRNSGETPYAGAEVVDALAGVLDDATYNGDATATRGAVALTGSNLIWKGDLGVGEVATITYTVTARQPPDGDKGMTSRLSSTAAGSSCPPGGGAATCVSTVRVLTPALTITKSADAANVTLGSTVTYTVLVRNTGQTSYPAATFDDALTGVLDDATYDPAATTATSGTVVRTGGVLRWTGALAPGAEATVSYAVTLNNPATGDRTLVNTVSSTTTGNNCSPGSGDPRCVATVAVTNAVTLTFEKTADVRTTAPGAKVTYTATVTNARTTAVADVTFTDPLAGVLDDASYGNDVSASSGTASFAADGISWTGTVAAGATVTLTYSVTVSPAKTGDDILASSLSSTSLPGSSNCAAASTDPRCTSTVPVARLLLERTAPATTTPGALVRFPVTFTNTGQVPYFGISVTMPRKDSADDVYASEEIVPSSGTIVRTEEASVWTGDIPVGGTVTIPFARTAYDPPTGDRRIKATLVSDAPGNNCPPGTVDPRCSMDIRVLVPALDVAVTADRTFVVPNGVVAYTVTVRNTGETPYVGARVTDALGGVLDDATYNGDAAATAGTVVFADPDLTWTGDLAVGQAAIVTFTVTAHRPADGDKGMASRVTSTDAGSSCPPNTSNASCGNTVAVRSQILTTVASASTDSAVPGERVTYTVTTTNTGQTDYTTATFAAPLAGLLDDAVYADDATATNGSVVRTGDSLVWTGPLVQGAQVVVTYSVTVKDPVPDAGDHRLEQTLTSIRNGSNCLADSTDPRCTTSVPIASLQIVNSADVTSAKPTDVVRYQGTFTNTGQVPYVGITISDSFVGALDNATYNGDATATSGSVIIVVGSGRVQWTGDVPVGATVTITGSVTVNNPKTGDGTLSTTITTDAPATNCPVGGTDPACSTSVAALTPALSIAKVADRVVTTPGGTVGYTITATNTGQTPYVGAQISDDLASVLTDARYGGGATATVGSVALADQRLTWTGDLGVGQSVVITYRVTVDDPDLGDKLMVNRVTSDELGSTCPTGGSRSACTSTVTVLVPALDIDIAASNSTTTPGAAVGYTLTITNTGQTDYPGAQVTASLLGVTTNAAYAGDAVSTTGTTRYAESALTWRGDLAVGATATITYSVRVDDGLPTGQQLTTSVSSAEPGSTCTSAAPCLNTVTILIPGLAISTTADAPTATPGDPVTFTLRVQNTGQTAYRGATVSTALTDVLDDAALDGPVTASSGVATSAAGDVSWTGDLAVGADPVLITYRVRVLDPDPGNRVLTATAVSSDPGSTCPPGTDDAICTATVTVLVPSLAITKTADVATTTPGSVVRYTITATNTGQTSYTGATVSDSLGDVLTDAAYNGDAVATGGGAVSYRAEELIWTGDLLIGASASITYSVTVAERPTGDKQLTNRAVSTTPGSTCRPDSTVATCAVTVPVLIPGLQITKTADRSTVVAGSPVRYTVTLTNTGETDYAPATFTDPLTDVLDDATYAGGAVASSGTVGYANGTVAWSGALVRGETATITYAVTTDFPARGNEVLRNQVVSQSAGATCPASSTDQACRSEVTVLVPALSITKTADLTRVVAGGRVSYTIQAVNTGQAPYPAAALTDPLTDVLDDATYDGNATATSGTVRFDAGTLSWTGALGTDESVLITYSVTTPLDPAGNASLVNTVSSDDVGSTCPVGGGGPSCASTVGVDAQVLTLSDMTSSFELTGLPGATVTDEDAVSMTVTTNSPGGYSVTVQAADDVLAPATPGNSDTIPVDQLRVRDSGQELWQPLSAENPFVVRTKSSASGPAGDAVSNGYQVDIPFVAADTYSTTLDYVVVTQ
ncbi:DUF11 domain-containing protein [Microlunatus lacustris]